MVWFRMTIFAIVAASAIASASAASFAPVWEKAEAISPSKSIFGLPITGFLPCPEADYTWTAERLWKGRDGAYAPFPFPSPDRVSQGPFYLNSGLFMAASDQSGATRTFHFRDGKWEDQTEKNTISAPCCGTFAAAGDRLVQYFRDEIQITGSSDDADPGAWTSLGRPFIDTLVSVKASVTGTLLAEGRGEAANPVVRYRLDEDTTWSALRTDSLPGAGFRVLGLDGDIVAVAVAQDAILDVGAPGSDRTEG